MLKLLQKWRKKLLREKIWNLYLIQKEKKVNYCTKVKVDSKNLCQIKKTVEGFASDYKDKITKDVAPITYEN